MCLSPFHFPHSWFPHKFLSFIGHCGNCTVCSASTAGLAMTFTSKLIYDHPRAIWKRRNHYHCCLCWLSFNNLLHSLWHTVHNITCALCRQFFGSLDVMFCYIAHTPHSLYKTNWQYMESCKKTKRLKPLIIAYCLNATEMTRSSVILVKLVNICPKLYANFSQCLFLYYLRHCSRFSTIHFIIQKTSPFNLLIPEFMCSHAWQM